MRSPRPNTTPLDNDAAKGLVQLSSSFAQMTYTEDTPVDCEVSSFPINMEGDEIEENKNRRSSDSDSSPSNQETSNQNNALASESDINSMDDSSAVLDFGTKEKNITPNRMIILHL